MSEFLRSGGPSRLHPESIGDVVARRPRSPEAGATSGSTPKLTPVVRLRLFTIGSTSASRIGIVVMRSGPDERDKVGQAGSPISATAFGAPEFERARVRTQLRHQDFPPEIRVGCGDPPQSDLRLPPLVVVQLRTCGISFLHDAEAGGKRALRIETLSLAACRHDR